MFVLLFQNPQSEKFETRLGMGDAERKWLRRHNISRSCCFPSSYNGTGILERGGFYTWGKIDEIQYLINAIVLPSN
jgi:hypothetical protein